MSPLVLRRALCVLTFAACGSIDPSISRDTAESHFQFAVPLQIYFGPAISRLSTQNQVISGHLASSDRNPLQLVWQRWRSIESSLAHPIGGLARIRRTQAGRCKAVDLSISFRVKLFPLRPLCFILLYLQTSFLSAHGLSVAFKFIVPGSIASPK